MIQRNRHPAGRCSNAIFGALEIVDGLVRLGSCGFLHTRLLVTYTRIQTAKAIQWAKNKRAKEQGK